jgi:hypothetical protein
MAQNKAHLKQENGLDNRLKVLQSGDVNILIGIPELENSAYQNSQNAGRNDIDVKQINNMEGANTIFLYQSASENNLADLTQENGLHKLVLKGTSTTGSNEAHITQRNGNGFINIEQQAFSDNIIPSSENTLMDNPSGYSGISQEGYNNFIFGAREGYDVDLGTIALPASDLPARQISETGSNWLEVWQTGGNNIVGLYQEATNDNAAFIHQYNGYNIAVSFQKGGGSNYAHIEQAGSMAAYIYQSRGADNRAIIVQH